ncbi:CHAD domain-containing protein [Kushneria phosphatilytica]|nr:CHAD domain-containing protein [Kushneria phosphatilytica]OHV08811.1 hypothetical protein BH688_12410 [Kushneria phosphatilytica]
MSYRLRADESVETGIQRIVIEQIDRARRELQDEDRVAAIHHFRQRCKKIRAALRLVRPALGKHFARENERFRDLGRSVAGARDSQMLVETFDHLLEQGDGGSDRRRFAPIRNVLVARRTAALESSDNEDRIARLDKAMMEARAEVPEWSLRREGFAAVRGGLDRTYYRAGRSMHVARKKARASDYHEWRKRVKYHRYHCDLLRNIWKAPMKARGQELHRLSDLLGEEHDLAVLEEVVRNPANDLARYKYQPALLELISQRRAALQQAVMPLGQCLFDEQSEALGDRLALYWQAWQTMWATGQ